MNRNVAAYIEIAVSIAGIIVAVLTAPDFLSALAKIADTKNLPPGFAAIAGGVATFSILFVLSAFLFLLGMGLVVLLVRIAMQFSSRFPTLMAVLTILSLVSMTASITIGAYNNVLWSAFFVLGLTFALGALSTVAKNLEPFGMVMSFGVIGSLILGFWCLGVTGAFSSSAPIVDDAYVESNSPKPAP